MTNHERGEVTCSVSFGKQGWEVEGSGPSLRIALLREFVRQAFGRKVDDEILRRPQALTGLRADGCARGVERGDIGGGYAVAEHAYWRYRLEPARVRRFRRGAA
ncbi:hypothetical protein BRCH_01624 [Candidatus Burkholderia brachyanthoides]|nr:hypothetical protein BRCH_01624 [Candidatus Burkholderia brachyanthoides]